MTNFKVPFEVKFEDKIIGGLMTVRQAVWFILPLIIIGLLVEDHSLTTKIINGHKCMNWPVIIPLVLLAIILTIISIIFAFNKVEGENLDKYLFKKFKYTYTNTKIKYYK